jgi:crossover junction endonuclease MUS81
LEDKLRVYCAAEGLPMPLKPGHSATEQQVAAAAAGIPSTTTTTTTTGTKKRSATSRTYIPKYRSGGWAILRALETFPPDSSQTKADIIRVAHQYCDSSFDTPMDNKFYTAWNSMKTLLEKGYVYKCGNPPKFCVTEEGAEVAKTIARTSGENSKDDGPSQKRLRSEESSQMSFIPPDSLEFLDLPGSQMSRQFGGGYDTPQISQIPAPLTRDTRVLPAGSYSIQLVMDNREIHSQVDKDRLEREIGEAGIDYTVRALDVGDVLWIAKSGSDEYVLDYIVERKRMDDLVSSITDGRFHEQKVAYLIIHD